MVATLIALSALLMQQSTAGSTTLPPQPASKPVVEVSIEASVKGMFDYQLDQDEFRSLVLSALENSGIRQGVIFLSRDKETEKGGVTDRDTSGYYEPGNEKGQFQRPSHRLRVTAVIERSIKRENKAALVSDIIRILGRNENYTQDIQKVTEKVELRIRGNIFALPSTVSVAAVGTIEGRASREEYFRREDSLWHKEFIEFFFIRIPIRVDDYQLVTSQSSTTGELGLSSKVIDGAAECFAIKLKEVLTGAKEVQKSALPDLVAESVSQERRSVTLSGKIESLKLGDILAVPITQRDREDRVGEESHVYVRVVRIGKEVATAAVLDGPEGRHLSQLEQGYVLDRRRPVRRA